MSANAHADAGAGLVRLRTPLARIELAASQLARIASSPIGRALAEDISAAVAEIDEQIAARIQAFESAPLPASAEDCRPVLETLRQRFEPLLGARGLTWTRLPTEAPDDAVLGDPAMARDAALSLLQSGIAFAETGSGIGLAFDSPADDAPVRLVLHVTPPASGAAAASEEHALASFAPTRRFALGRGGALEVTADDRCVRAALSFANGEPA